MLNGLPVVPFEEIEQSHPPADHRMSILLGFRDVNRLRARKYQEAKAKGYALVNYVSSRAIVYPDLVLGDNCHIHEGSVVQPFARLGSDVVLGPGTMVGHHSRIDNHCFVAAQATVLGRSAVGSHCVLGANSTIVDGVIVASHCIVGAGAVITRNTQEGEVYIGSAPRLLSKSSGDLAPLLTWPR
jgi:sugar O-acyltransferase (sialic acid O-acetyltransferase NeuD family)